MKADMTPVLAQITGKMAGAIHGDVMHGRRNRV